MKKLFTVIFVLLLMNIYCKKTETPVEIKTENKEQSAAVVDADTIVLTTLEWEPYIGESIKGKGYVYQIVEEAFKKVGKKVVIKFYPWSRTVQMSQDGDVDGHFPEWYGDSRLDNWIFSDSFPGGPMGLYKRIGDNIKFSVDPQKDPEKALRALKNYKFGATREYINTAEFDRAAGLNIPESLSADEKKALEAQKYLQVELADSDEVSLKKLFGKRLDLIVIDQYVAKSLIVQKYPHYLDSLEFMNPPLEIKPLYICFSKKTPNYQEKCDLFNKGLSMIKADGSLDKIMRDNGF